MSRYNFDIDENKYATVGWDPPFQSFFYQIWNREDEKKIAALENYLKNSVSVVSYQQRELDELYDKYDSTGGEPIISQFGADGLDYINSLTQLQELLSKLKVAVPPTIQKQLQSDYESDRLL